MNTRHNFLWVTAFLLVGLAGSALPGAPGAGGRERVRFDDGWRFHLSDETTGQPPGVVADGIPVAGWRWKLAQNPAAEVGEVTRPDFDDAAWDPTPANLNLLAKSGMSAWLRTVLTNGSARAQLHFQGVDDVGTVYLNGQKLAEHTGWEEAFDVPLGAAWKEGGPNVLVVLVENTGGAGGINEVLVQDPSVAPPADAVASGPAATRYDDGAWRTVHLPHDFVIEGTFDPKADLSHGFLSKKAGWYRKTFELAAEDKNRVLWLEFDGVYRNSIVWLNGHRLGRHASGYTSFHYDIGGAANFGGANVLTVWADARQDEGWWYEGGGIYRHVYLTRLAPMHVDHWGMHVVATPSADLRTAEVAVEVDLVNEGGAGAAGGVESVLLDPEGHRVGAVETPGQGELAAGEKRTVTQRLSVDGPRLWSPDAPTLYTLQTTVRRGQEIVDRQDTTVGFRSLRWDADQGFFLNGKPFKIQGTCNHQDFAGLGVALPDRTHAYKVELLKAMGSNAFRYSHHAMAPELLDACDRLGMVVMNENRKLGDSPEILGQVESLVRRDRNHPSVILWSMCNEEKAQGSEAGRRMFAAMKAVVEKWDRTRPVSAAMHGYFGSGISLESDLQGFNYHVNSYDAFHKKFPRQPCYGSETASEKTTRGIYADDPNKGYCTSLKAGAEQAWKPVAERPWMAGGFVWTGFDYRGEPSPYQWPCISSHFGIMDTCGFPKDSYYYYLSEWGGKPVAHIMQQWNRAGQEGQQISVRVVGNAARYELFLNGTSLGAQAMPAHEHLEWKVAYAPGTLEARGYDAAGKTVAVYKLETTGAPARLELVPDSSTRLAADGEDVVFVRCHVLDAQGRVVPVADDLVTFSVAGPAAVAGVGNGNPSDHDPDKASARHAFNGRCLVIVQSKDGEAGEVVLSATAPGLIPAIVTLRANR